jgi:TRAP-type C4-dicarboxylate transport system substrate-binding protein
MPWGVGSFEMLRDKMMNRIRLLGFWAAGTVFLVGTTALAGTTWDMPTAYPATNFQTVNAQEFSQCVATATAGDLNIVIHANGSLFKGNDIKRAVQTGQAQIGERLLSSHENENPIFGTDSIPFLATSYDASVKLFAAARPELNKVLDAQGLELLYSVPWPPQGLYFNKDVNTVADMAGIKVRSYNKATARLSELTGMVPISIEAAEISQALSAGVISSLITSAVTGQDSKVWEQLNHFYEVKAWMPRNSMIVNKGIFEALPDKDKAAVKGCATKAEASGLQKSKAANDDAMANLKKNGMQVIAPSPAFAAEMQKIGTTMTAEWVAKAGDPGKAVIDGFKK